MFIHTYYIQLRNATSKKVKVGKSKHSKMDLFQAQNNLNSAKNKEFHVLLGASDSFSPDYGYPESISGSAVEGKSDVSCSRDGATKASTPSTGRNCNILKKES